MRLCSTHNPALSASFQEAVGRGTPGDGGLFMPASIPRLPDTLVRSFHSFSFQETAFQAARLLLEGEIPDAALHRIIEESLTFPAPLRALDDRTMIVELFHGPTLAFKDFGARFMARVVAHFRRGDDRPSTVLVATSGDTGSAVAHAFNDVEGVSVVLLYPSGRVAPVQELQLTTAGPRVTALEIDGTFDDCQRLVKAAFADREVSSRRRLTSANSINIARLLPQTFYYFHAYAQLGPDPPAVFFSVPSGNLGNLTAGLIAKAMGLPVEHFVAGSNINDALPRFLATGIPTPAPAVATLSSAMDVGDPSNLARIIAMFGNDLHALRQQLSSLVVTDQETREAIRTVFREWRYLMDPHTAVAWRALEKYRSSLKEARPGSKAPPWSRNNSQLGLVLSTADPAKFPHTLDEELSGSLVVPESLRALRPEMKRSVRLTGDFDTFKEFLLQS